MFRIKFSTKEKEMIKQILGISEKEPYEIVLCSKQEDMELDKINLVFSMHQIDEIKTKLQFFTDVKEVILIGKTHRGEVRVTLHSIVAIESFGNDVFAYVDQQEIQLPQRLYQLEEEFKEFGFIRVSKSMIVNITQVDSISSFINGKLLLNMKNGKQYEVNRSYTKEFKQYLKGGNNRW